MADNNNMSENLAFLDVLILQAIDEIRHNSRRPDRSSITKYVMKNNPGLTNEKKLKEVIDDMERRDVIENRKTPSGLDSFFPSFNISLTELVQSNTTPSIGNIPDTPIITISPQNDNTHCKSDMSYETLLTKLELQLDSKFLVMKTLFQNELKSISDKIDRSYISLPDIISEKIHLDFAKSTATHEKDYDKLSNRVTELEKENKILQDKCSKMEEKYLDIVLRESAFKSEIISLFSNLDVNKTSITKSSYYPSSSYRSMNVLQDNAISSPNRNIIKRKSHQTVCDDVNNSVTSKENPWQHPKNTINNVNLNDSSHSIPLSNRYDILDETADETKADDVASSSSRVTPSKLPPTFISHNQIPQHIMHYLTLKNIIMIRQSYKLEQTISSAIKMLMKKS